MSALNLHNLEENSDVRRLATMIYEHCGIQYMDNLYSLSSKLQTRLNALQLSCSEYIDYLRRTPEEWEPLIEAVTINETYFFREDGQLQELVTNVLPELSERPIVRIWCAACSTGEEPYSIAMTIAESGILPLSRVEVYATDINRKVLRVAERGYYDSRSMCFRRTTEEMKAKYFVPEGQGYRVRDEIRAAVRFGRLNLVSPTERSPVPIVDAIFCRNVLIYFDQPTIRNVIARLSERLTEGGHLFLGHAESISGLASEFRTVNAPTTFYYRKGGEAR
ncbi:protein-glutamate O-methyltransferase CheR [Paenibacillus sp. TRM 82003]|nr:protein-glutamate O-methyltransferase CheR [Paenibacillus sp. TRM 82003]